MDGFQNSNYCVQQLQQQLQQQQQQGQPSWASAMMGGGASLPPQWMAGAQLPSTQSSTYRVQPVAIQGPNSTQFGTVVTSTVDPLTGNSNATPSQYLVTSRGAQPLPQSQQPRGPGHQQQLTMAGQQQQLQQQQQQQQFMTQPIALPGQGQQPQWLSQLMASAAVNPTAPTMLQPPTVQQYLHSPMMGMENASLDGGPSYQPQWSPQQAQQQQPWADANLLSAMQNMMKETAKTAAAAALKKSKSSSKKHSSHHHSHRRRNEEAEAEEEDANNDDEDGEQANADANEGFDAEQDDNAAANDDDDNAAEPDRHRHRHHHHHHHRSGHHRHRSSSHHHHRSSPGSPTPHSRHHSNSHNHSSHHRHASHDRSRSHHHHRSSSPQQQRHRSPSPPRRHSHSHHHSQPQQQPQHQQRETMTIVMDHDTRRFEVRPIPANAAASQQPIRAPAANPPTILLRRRDNAAAPRRVIVVDADARGRFGGERDDFGPGMGLPRVAIAGRRAAPGQGAATLTTSERYRLAGHPRRVVVARGDGGVGGPGGAMGGGGAGGGPGGWDEREQGPREQVAAGEFEPYGYREWLALRNRDRMMRLPASLGVNEDEEWKRKHEKVARMQEYARRPTHGRHHHKSDRQQPVGRKLARQASQQQVDDSGDDNSINVNVKLEFV